jgi:hypothetical protein
MSTMVHSIFMNGRLGSDSGFYMEGVDIIGCGRFRILYGGRRYYWMWSISDFIWRA